MNLILSLVYNSLSIPFAAGIFYPLVRARIPPTLAAIAMALSSVSVVGSSLALRFYTEPSIEVRQRRNSTTRRRSRSNRGGQTGADNGDLTEPLLQHETTERTANLSEMEEGEACIVRV